MVITKLRLAIMTLAVVGLLAGLLTLVPLTGASGPKETLAGSFVSVFSNLVQTPRGAGAVVVKFDTATTFSGKIDGVAEGHATNVVQLKGGGFTLHLQGADFVGTIDGKTGTAKVNATGHGVAHPTIAGCCFQATIQFYDGTDGLEGLAAKGALTNDPTNGRRYSVDVHFR